MTRLTIDSNLRSARGAILFGRGPAANRSLWKAPVESRADWGHAGPTPRMTTLDAVTRLTLAEHWLAAGTRKHAEVARFAMLSIELMALGGAPALIRGAQLTMGDKIDHARLCFGLASAYAGKPLGPGRLDTAGASSCPIFEDVLDRVVCDGCIAQTLASLQAQEALVSATDPVVQAVLERLAEDGARHTRWAWQMLRWGIARATTTQRATILFRLEAAVASAAGGIVPEKQEHDDVAAKLHGVLCERVLFDVASRGLAEVIEPCARALLEQVDQPAHRFGLEA